MKTISLNTTIPEHLQQSRLDTALARLFPDYSRSQLQTWIRDGFVTIDGSVIQKTRHSVQMGQHIVITAIVSENTRAEPQPIPLTIVYEDEALLVINKPVGLVVHPGAGNPDSTLVNALIHHAPDLAAIPRAGVIHRLDKDTSGLLVIAKTLPVHHQLIQQMQTREIHREYRALVHGNMISGGTIDAPIGRHPQHRTKMAVTPSGNPAITHYRVLQRFQAHTLLSVLLETGRTHQIRVHLSHIHYPIVGDQTYGTHRQRHYPQLSEKAQIALNHFKHQALHACRLSLLHPISGKSMAWEAALPEDFLTLIELLAKP